jgi:hypothetical protein
MESTRRIRRAGNRRAAEMGTQHLLRVLAFCAAWLQVCASPFPPLWICCFARTRHAVRFPSNAYPHIRLGAIATALQLYCCPLHYYFSVQNNAPEFTAGQQACCETAVLARLRAATYIVILFLDPSKTTVDSFGCISGD